MRSSYRERIGRALAALIVPLLILDPAFGQTHKVTLDDVFAREEPTDVELSPDGSKIVFVIERPGPKNVYSETSNLWILDVRTKAVKKLTNGNSDSRPQWSPNGRDVAFLSSRGGSPQVWLIDTQGGEAVQLTGSTSEGPRVKGSILQFRWSPDGARIATFFVPSGSDEKAASEIPKVVAASRMPKYFTQNTVNASFLEVFDVASKGVTRLTGDELTMMGGYAMALEWSPDSQFLLFNALKTGTLFANVMNESDLYRVSVATKEVVKIGGQKLADYLAVWSPDGREIGYLSDNGISVYEDSRSLRVCAADGGGHRTVSGNYTNASVNLPVTWTKQGEGIYFAGRDHATQRVLAISPASGKIRRITPEAMFVRDYSLSADERRMAAVFENANTPPDIYIGDPRKGIFEKLTGLNPGLRELSLGAVDLVRWKSKDGRFMVEAFLVKPPDFVQGKRYPLLVNVHGGPGSSYMDTFFDLSFESAYHTPARIYAAEGYLVLLPNPRGDYSYSQEYIDAFRKDWGSDFDNDVDAGIDYLIAQGLADGERLGIMGHSYGGYSTTWAVTQTERFKAASISDSPSRPHQLLRSALSGFRRIL